MNEAIDIQNSKELQKRVYISLRQILSLAASIVALNNMENPSSEKLIKDIEEFLVDENNFPEKELFSFLDISEAFVSYGDYIYAAWAAEICPVVGGLIYREELPGIYRRKHDEDIIKYMTKSSSRND